MGPFEYDANRTRATVHFQAHKFPYTASVYYQCNVRLCLRKGGCDEVVSQSAPSAGRTAFLNDVKLVDDLCKCYTAASAV
jgi:hypothetical protein